MNPSERYSAIPEAAYPISRYIPRGVLNTSQRDMVEIIEEEAQDYKVPPAVAMAMVANAMGESNLEPGAIYREKSGYDSVGLFQLHGAPGAAGAGMTVEERKDPVTNTQIILKELFSTRKKKPGCVPAYAIEHPLDAHDRGVREVGHLTAGFLCYVERPQYNAEKDTRRRKLAVRLFPDFVTTPLAPRAGTPLPAPDAEEENGFFDWVASFFTSEPQTSTWTSEDRRIGLAGPNGKISPGTVPSGTYSLVWDGKTVPGATVQFEGGKSYRAVREGSTVKFKPL